MVQRKLVINKLGIQADHVKSEKGSSPSQNQDNKNKGADLKKKMKKSRSTKHSDFESLRSTPPLRNKDIPQPGKPPTSDQVKTRAATPQRQSPVKAPEASPNYMKSTSSFDARKERSQVSPQTPQNVMIRKSMSPAKSNNSRHSLDSNHKALGALARTSSLKLVRTLTKTPSFKPARASTKKYSPIALCEDFDVQKPTCSSTLKDSKFPTYLELSAGATESEGTSAMKVCPYTYCSLNGHHHAPVPPLKSFLSAKRRMLKAQKIIKLGCLSPRRAKPSRERMIKIDAKQVILAKIPPTKEMDFNSSPMIPLMHEKQTDFFVEIYSNNRNDTAKEKTLEGLSSKPPCSVIDFEDNPDQSSGNIAATVNDIKLFNQNTEEGVDIHPLPIAQEDARLECTSTQVNSDEESQPNSGHAQSDVDASDMEWEAGHHCELNLDGVPIPKVEVTDTYNGSNLKAISKSVYDENNSYEDIVADEVRVGFYDEKSVSSGAWSDDGDSDLDGSYQNMVFDESYLAYTEKIQGKIYSTCDALEDLTSTGEDGNRESIETRGKENIISHHNEELQETTVEKRQVPEASEEIPKMNFELGSNATKCTSDVEEVLFGLQEDEASQDENVSWLLQNQDCNPVLQDLIEQDQDETHKDHNAIENNMKVFELDFTSERRFNNDVSDESFLAKSEYGEADQEDHDQKISIADAREGMEEKEVLVTESFDGIRTSESVEDYEQEQPIADIRDGMEEKEQILAAKSFDRNQPLELLQEFPEPIQDKIATNNDQSKQTDVTVESETNQTYADEVLPYGSNGVGNHEYPEMNHDQTETYKFTGSKYSEDQIHSEAAVLQTTPNQNQEADTGEGEYKTKPDTAETSFVEKASTNTHSDFISNASSNSNEEMSKTVAKSSWTIGSRKTVAELEDIHDFNPREPNYLPVEPDLEAEKVDLRHQMMDERKNAEEWMVDYALRQAVTKLAPARRRKVSLLVEAFEKVLPTPKYETSPRHTSPAFVQSRTIQACR